MGSGATILVVDDNAENRALAKATLEDDGFPVEISLSPIQHAGERLVVAGIRDVTDRREIEREAKRANAYLVSAVDAIQDAFALYDEDDRVVLVNSTCRQLLAYHGSPSRTLFSRSCSWTAAAD